MSRRVSIYTICDDELWTLFSDSLSIYLAALRNNLAMLTCGFFLGVRFLHINI